MPFITPYIMKSLIALSFPLLAIQPLSAASVITGGDFESWTSGNANGWLDYDSGDASQVTGLTGSGSAARLTGATNAGAALQQMTSSAITSGFLLEFEFQNHSTGTDKNGDRIMNLTLRSSTDANPVLNMRSVYDTGSSNNGLLQFYNGSSWTTISGQTEVFNQTDVYRITISGDVSAGNRSYDVSIFNVTDNITAGGQSGMTAFHTSNSDISEVRIERGRSDFDWTIDNIVLEAIPEPSSAALAMVGSLVLLRRRRN